MKYLEKNMASLGSDKQNLNILAIFLHLCGKNKDSLSGDLKLSKSNLKTILSILSKKVSGKELKAEDFFYVLTLMNFISKSQISSGKKKLKKVIEQLAEKYSSLESNIEKISKFQEENGQLAIENFYNKRIMEQFLLESKNGCLKSSTDILTYISKPLIKVILKKVDFDNEVKNKLVCKILKSTLNLGNLNWVVTENLLSYKKWLRLQMKKGAHTLVLHNLVIHTGIKNQSVLLHTLLTGLQSQYFTVRRDILSLLED